MNLYFLGVNHSDIPTLDDNQLSSFANKIPGDKLEQFVLEKLGIQGTTLSQIKETELGNVYKIILECLVRWRNMTECAGEDAGLKLQPILRGDKMFSKIVRLLNL